MISYDTDSILHRAELDAERARQEGALGESRQKAVKIMWKALREIITEEAIESARSIATEAIAKVIEETHI